MAYGSPHRADAVVRRVVYGDDGRGLRQPVALDDGETSAVVDESQLFGQRRAARREEPDAPAKALAPLREDEARREPVLECERGRNAPLPHDVTRPALRDSHGPSEQSRLEPAVARGALLHAREDFFVEARHGCDERGPDLAHVLADLLDRLGEEDFRAVVQVHEHRAALVDVREREHGQSHVVGAEGEARRRVYQVRDDVRVREHHAFRLARRPRCVDDGRNVFGPHSAREFFEEAGPLRVELSATLL